MKKLIFLVLLAACFSSQAHAQTPGCGATSGGASQYDQSVCGNVSPFPAAASGSAFSGPCGSSLPAGTYYLTQSIGTSPGDICITFTSGPVTFDFAGFTITGRIFGNGISMSGTHLYSSAPGGTVNCSAAPSGFPGCVSLVNGG